MIDPGVTTGNPAIAHSDPQANRMGMWLFLATEVVLFGAILLAYAVYYHDYGHHFRNGSAHLNIALGALNTLVLLTSSLAVALAIGFLQRGRNRACLISLSMTVLCALAFLGIKAMEWTAKFTHGYYPRGELVVDLPGGEKIFVGIYFLATGLHALHVIVGMVVLLLAAFRVYQRRCGPGRDCLLVNAGLFWHLVDLIWIFLFPLFYLIA